MDKGKSWEFEGKAEGNRIKNSHGVKCTASRLYNFKLGSFANIAGAHSSSCYSDENESSKAVGTEELLSLIHI